MQVVQAIDLLEVKNVQSHCEIFRGNFSSTNAILWNPKLFRIDRIINVLVIF